MKISYLFIGTIFLSVCITPTLASDKVEVLNTIDIAQVIENTNNYDKTTVSIKAFVSLKKIEERSLFSCESSESLYKEKYIYLDLFTEIPNNKNFIKLGAEADIKYEKYKVYDQQCAIVKGVFYKSNINGREVGRLVLDDISANQVTE